jgi:uncharacterized protein YjbI with pentapeptide repeats
LEEANLQGANLQGANLNSANCRHANFRNANMGQDDLGGASMIFGTDFTDANLAGVMVEGAMYDVGTIFPAGFDLAAHRLVLYRHLTGN